MLDAVLLHASDGVAERSHAWRLRVRLPWSRRLLSCKGLTCAFSLFEALELLRKGIAESFPPENINGLSFGVFFSLLRRILPLDEAVVIFLGLQSMLVFQPYLLVGQTSVEVFFVLDDGFRDGLL